jgi:alpha-L-arabinofuranosidase
LVPRAILLVALAVSLLLAAGVVIGKIVGAGSDTITGAARIDVDLSLRVSTAGDLIGAVVNEPYFGPSDPLHPDWNDDYLGRTTGYVRELAPANGRRFAVRFGHTPTDGSWGKDGYHWMSALGPTEWDSSIDEFMEYAKLADGEPYVAVNFGSGTADEAAGLVSYVNGTDAGDKYVALRLQRGHPEPYNVRDWIVGFEQYASWETGHQADREFDFANPLSTNGGDPEWRDRPSSDPRNFAARAAQYATRMRAASPIPIRLCAPLNNWDLEYWGGPEASASAVLPVLSDLVDSVSLHFYPTNPGYGESDEDLLGRPETLSGKLEQARVLLSRYGSNGRQLQIGDVEYNNRSSSTGQTHQLVNALFVADTIRVLAIKGVSSAFYFAISVPPGSKSGFSYFEDGDVNRPMPTYLATKLISSHLGSELFKAEVSKARVVSAPGGTTGHFSYPTLTALASLAPDRRTLYLVVINKHLLVDQAADVNLAGAGVNGVAQVTTLNGPSAGSTAGSVVLTESSARVGSAFRYQFPAHSITGMRFTLSSPMP